MIKNSIYIIVLLLIVFSCKEIEARRPKEHSVTNFYKEVIEQNKRLNTLENEKIKEIISKDTILNFKPSNNGFWYAFLEKDSINTATPKKGDLITISYDIKTLYNQPVYNEKEVDYKIDEQNFIPGLEEGVKLMKKGEKAVFIIPSYAAYGVTGDGDKIKINQTIKSTIQLIQIQKNNEVN